MFQPVIDRSRPFGKLSPRRVYPITPEQIQPAVRIAHRRTGSGLQILPRIIFDHELVLNLAGSWRITMGSKVQDLEPHDLILIPPFLPHRIDCPAGQPTDHIAIHFDFALNVPSIGRNLMHRTPYEVRLSEGLALPLRMALHKNDRVERAFLELLKAWTSKTGWEQMEVRACLLHILGALFEEAKNRPCPGAFPSGGWRTQAHFGRVAAHVSAHLAEPLHAAALARVAGLSLSHFNRRFRECAGCSPMDYVRQRRIAHARELLANVALSIKEIAALTGFTDPYQFSKSFRHLDGLSPSEFREAALAGKRTLPDSTPLEFPAF